MDWGPWESMTHGKKPMEIKGPFTQKQPRLNPDAEFLQIDREWRKQWFKDQKLSPKDAKMHHLDIYYNPDYRKARQVFQRNKPKTSAKLFEF